jgi:hypothetical protein
MINMLRVRGGVFCTRTHTVRICTHAHARAACEQCNKTGVCLSSTHILITHHLNIRLFLSKWDVRASVRQWTDMCVCMPPTDELYEHDITRENM